MFDIGWTELMLIGVVALIVVGPKDLPHLFHALGRFTAKARGMAREFSSAMEDAAKGSGLDDAAGSLREMKSLTSKKALGLDALDRAAERFEKWDPKRPETRKNAPVAPTPDPGAAGTVPVDGVSPASTLDAPTAAAAQPAPTRPFGASSSTAKPAGDTAAEDPAPTPGARRIHAVRRSDTKDD